MKKTKQKYQRLSLHAVHKNLEEWTESLKSELSSQRTKERLIPIKAKKVKELAERTDAKAPDKACGGEKEEAE